MARNRKRNKRRGFFPLRRRDHRLRRLLLRSRRLLLQVTKCELRRVSFSMVNRTPISSLETRAKVSTHVWRGGSFKLAGRVNQEQPVFASDKSSNKRVVQDRLRKLPARRHTISTYLSSKASSIQIKLPRASVEPSVVSGRSKSRTKRVPITSRLLEMGL